MSNDNSPSGLPCPVCGGQTVHHCPAPNWGEMRKCLSCSLVSANPMTLPEEPASLFDKAYKGKVTDADMHQFAIRLKLRADFKNLAIGAQGLGKGRALKWLSSNVPLGAAVLDIGCGAGLFLCALEKAGFQPLGLDISQEVVDALQRDGYHVCQGNVKHLPTDWPEPAACTCFFVLHHSPDPVAFLRDIRLRFVHAPLLLAEYEYSWGTTSPPRATISASFPPRTLSWWPQKALEVALGRAGYDVNAVVSPVVDYSDYGVPRLTNLYLGLRDKLPLRRLLPHYFRTKKVLFAPQAFLGRLTRRRKYNLVIGVPSQGTRK